MNFIPHSSIIEKYLKSSPVAFTLIIIYQGLLSGNALKNNPPQRLKPFFNSPFFRFISIFLVALSATKDIEHAFVSVIIYIVFMFIIHTDEEKENLAFFGLI